MEEKKILRKILNKQIVNVMKLAREGSLSGLRKSKGEYTFDKGAVERAKAILTNSTWGLKDQFGKIYD